MRLISANDFGSTIDFAISQPESKVWAMDFEQEYTDSKARHRPNKESKEDAERQAQKRLSANSKLFSCCPG